jgi:hypothetical protein
MKQEDVKAGYRVVPFQKTMTSMDLKEWLKYPEGKKFKKDGYATVTNTLDDAFTLNDYGFFNASDFEPYIEPVKGLALAYMRALGQTVDDIRIEINPAKTEDTADYSAPQQDKPLTFEVGETVRIRNDLIAGNFYDGSCRFDLNMSQYRGTTQKVVGEHSGRHYFNGIDWCFSSDMLEKVPQPTKHEVIVDGVKYVKEANHD